MPFRIMKKKQWASCSPSWEKKISREWARDNRVRRVDTPMLQQWGENLRSAKRRGWDVLAEEIRKIDAELNRILV